MGRMRAIEMSLLVRFLSRLSFMRKALLRLDTMVVSESVELSRLIHLASTAVVTSAIGAEAQYRETLEQCVELNMVGIDLVDRQGKRCDKDRPYIWLCEPHENKIVRISAFFVSPCFVAA